MTTFFTLPTLPISGLRPSGIPVTLDRVPGKDLGGSVDRPLTWGFVLQVGRSGSSIRTDDRTAGGVMRDLLQSLLDSLDAEPLDDMATDEQVLDRTALLVAV